MEEKNVLKREKSECLDVWINMTGSKTDNYQNYPTCPSSSEE